MLKKVEIIKKLEDAGLSITNTRVVISLFLFNAKHPTAEDIIKHGKKSLPKVNVATIYNVIKDLEKVNLIKKIKFPHLEHLVYDVNTYHHFHFLDTKTGEITDISTDKVSLSNSLQEQYQIEGVDILFKGRVKK